MKSKQILVLTAVITSASLSSCIVPNSPDPVGDSFSRTGDAIGKVVNGTINAVNPNRTQQAQQQVLPQSYPQTTPYQGQ